MRDSKESSIEYQLKDTHPLDKMKGYYQKINWNLGILFFLINMKAHYQEDITMKGEHGVPIIHTVEEPSSMMTQADM